MAINKEKETSRTVCQHDTKDTNSACLVRYARNLRLSQYSKQSKRAKSSLVRLMHPRRPHSRAAPPLSSFSSSAALLHLPLFSCSAISFSCLQPRLSFSLTRSVPLSSSLSVTEPKLFLEILVSTNFLSSFKSFNECSRK